MNKLVECTVLRDLGKKLKRGDVVIFDPFKADAWESAGRIRKGRHTLSDPAATVVSKTRKSKKAKEEEVEVDG